MKLACVKEYNHSVIEIADFRERKISDEWIEDFDSYSKRQWKDFDYKINDGESLNEAQKRNVTALYKVLKRNPKENIVIATHGTALSLIINHFDKTFNYEDFYKVKNLFPWVVVCEFENNVLVDIKHIDIFSYQHKM